MSIADVSSALLDSLRKQMPPLIAPEQIAFHVPSDPGDGVLLGLFMYHACRDMKYQMNRNITVDSQIAQMPPLCVEVFFMITPYIGKKSGLLDDYKLLDRVLQIWHDNAALPFASALQPQFVAPPRLELLSYDPDTLSKVWQFPGTPYRPSLFYKVAPVAIASTVQAVTPRVRESALSAEERV